MPNFWSSTTQTFQEIFSGPKSKDKLIEFKKKEFEDESKIVFFIEKTFEKYIDYLKYSNKLFEEIKQDVSQFSFPETFLDYKDCFLYYSQYINQTIEFNNSLIFNLYHKKGEFEEMQKGYTLLNTQLEENEKYRKTYDHYNDKLDQMILKNEKMRKEQSIEEVKKYEEKIEKNKIKFEKALLEYINSNNKIYSLLNSSISTREVKIIIYINDFFNQINMKEVSISITKIISDAKKICEKRTNLYMESIYDPMNSLCDNKKLLKKGEQSNIINKCKTFQNSNNSLLNVPYSLETKKTLPCNDLLIKEFSSFQNKFSNEI